VVKLTDYLQTVLDIEIWGGWPICPLHDTHPTAAGAEPAGRGHLVLPPWPRRDGDRRLGERLRVGAPLPGSAWVGYQRLPARGPAVSAAGCESSAALVIDGGCAA
jgi:hypothetical protein